MGQAFPNGSYVQRYNARTPGGWGATYFSVTAGTEIKSSSGILHSLIVASGTNAGTVTVYDNTAASGNIICTITIAANSTVTYYIPDIGINFLTALYVNPSTTLITISGSYE